MIDARRSMDADAAAWLIRMNGPDRAAVRTALQAWLDECPDHRAAYERAEAAWAILPRAARELEKGDSHPAVRARPARRWAIAAGVGALIVCGLGWTLLGPDAYQTRLGEQRTATLEDGSRIALNTDTRLDVRFDRERRRVRLDHGEAMFEVAHDADRPFTVQVGDTEVRAVGTVFVVRRIRDEVTVTLISGRVIVKDVGGGTRGPAAVTLRPGEKLVEPSLGHSRVEAQSVEAATAWRRGQTVLENTPLGEAALELNRYGGPTLRIDDPRVAALPVSGVFSTNSADFAEAAAALHGLSVERTNDGLTLVQ